MIEAMACGTPVIAFRCGSVPEVIDEGVTGYVVDELDEAVACVERVQSARPPPLSREHLRSASAPRAWRGTTATSTSCLESSDGR